MRQVSMMFEIPAIRSVTRIGPSAFTNLTLAFVTAASLATAACSSGTRLPPVGQVGPSCQMAASQPSCAGQMYSCTGFATPQAYASKCDSKGMASDGTTSYCCVPLKCEPDPTGQACAVAGKNAPSQQSFLCPSGYVPPTNGSTWCIAQPASSDGTTPYCCVDFSSADCQQVGPACAAAGTTPFLCAGTASPEKADPSLLCGPVTKLDNGTSSYCCGPRSCTKLGAAYPCDSGSTAYSCPGYAVASEPGSTCAAFGVQSSTDPNNRFCCTPGPCVSLPVYPNDTTSPLTQCAAPGSGGWPYACTGSATPAKADGSQFCHTIGPGDPGRTDYCCYPGSCGYVNLGLNCDVGYTAAVLCTPGLMPSHLDPNLKSCVVVSSDSWGTHYCCN